MSRVPVITSPCPLRWASMPQAGKDHCGRCDRQVHNLDGMSAARREAFLAGCSGKVCVAYTVNAKRRTRNVALGAGLLAALVVPATALANDEAIGYVPLPAGEMGAVDTGTAQDEEVWEIMVGGVDDPRNARWADEAEVEASDALAEPEVIAASEWLPSAPE
jgi:hypothetical protein